MIHIEQSNIKAIVQGHAIFYLSFFSVICIVCTLGKTSTLQHIAELTLSTTAEFISKQEHNKPSKQMKIMKHKPAYPNKVLRS